MIKGTLLLSLPILVENFLSPKMRNFCSVFLTPWKNPWMDMSETYGQLLPSEALRPAIFGRFKDYSINKKINKIHNRNITALLWTATGRL